MNTCHIDVILLSNFALLGHTLIKPFGIICVGLENQPSVQTLPKPGPTSPIIEQMPVTQPVSEYKEDFPSNKTMLHENCAETEPKPVAPVQHTLPKKKIVKMVVLYDDHTFAEYYPE